MRVSRRTFASTLAAGAALVAAAPVTLVASGPSRFTFARARYRSGDWDTDPKMPANLLHSIVEYTKIPVDPREEVVALDSKDLLAYPFLYLSGHELVRLTRAEKEGLGRYVADGGFLFADDCNHDVDGLFARSFEREMEDLFPRRLKPVPNGHELYRAAFHFEAGPPTTTHELNGWGDNLVHDELKGIAVRGALNVLYSNKDYGCEWDYDPKSKQYLAEDNTKFGVNIVTYALCRG